MLDNKIGNENNFSYSHEIREFPVRAPICCVIFAPQFSYLLSVRHANTQTKRKRFQLMNN